MSSVQRVLVKQTPERDMYNLREWHTSSLRYASIASSGQLLTSNSPPPTPTQFFVLHLGRCGSGLQRYKGKGTAEGYDNTAAPARETLDKAES
ncbi:hypothetical protein UY3_05202 [Chelonia mydas]|uniref:Uncharacterized protein n=1 Tax=Chelonia mydas TaxID=8469 RepID=M7BPI2_CHEMY|nr:hypothetical protein UY3_05202 [Chelonia mydas]